MTDREKYTLLEFSYADLPARLKLPLSIYDAAAFMYPGGYMDTDLYTRLAASRELSRLEIAEYVNDTPGCAANTSDAVKSGFAGYLLRDGDEYIALLRGSDTESFSGAAADWGANVATALGADTLQLGRAEELCSRAAGRLTVMGHSKGGYLAAQVFLRRPQTRAYIVNGLPVFWPSLSDEERSAMRSDRMDFIVQKGDVVSALGYVDYISRVVQLKEGVAPSITASHSLENAAFARSGALIGAGAPGALRGISSQLFLGIEERLKALHVPAAAICAEQFNCIIASLIGLLSCMLSGDEQRARYIASRTVRYAHEHSEPLCGAVEAMAGELVLLARAR